MTESRRQQVNAASYKYWTRKAAERAQAGLTTRGTPKIYRHWETPGMPRHVRARLDRKYVPLADLVDRMAALLAKGFEFLPWELQDEATALAKQLATVKRHNKKRRVRTA